MNRSQTTVIFVASIVIFTCASYFLPVLNVELALVSLMLSIAAIVYGLLAGFFISAAWVRFTGIRDEAVREGSGFTAMVNMSKAFSNQNKIFREKLFSSIETYLIADLSVEWSAYFKTEKYFDDIELSVKHYKAASEKDTSLFEEILDNLSTCRSARDKLSVLGKSKLFLSEWFILVTLSCFIIFSLFLVRTDSMISLLVTTVFSAVIVMSLLLIYKLDDLKWDAYEVSYRPYENVFEDLGKLRYFCSGDILEGRIPKSQMVGKYRTEKSLRGELLRVHKEVVKARD